MVKRCPSCGEEKDVEEFRWKNRALGLRAVYCAPCFRERQRAHYQRNKASYIPRIRRNNDRVRAEVERRILEYLKEHPCVDCGESDPVVLEFDHVTGEKAGSISLLRNRSTWLTVLAEIQKCEVRCANCHRRRTAKQFGWRSRLPM